MLFHHELLCMVEGTLLNMKHLSMSNNVTESLIRMQESTGTKLEKSPKR